MKSGRERLRDWLDRSKVNQRDGAALLGIHYVNLSQILSGDRKPSLETAIRIEQVSGISAESWLLTTVSTNEEAEPVGARNRKITKR